jgi:hypothetical protein
VVGLDILAMEMKSLEDKRKLIAFVAGGLVDRYIPAFGPGGCGSACCLQLNFT